MSVDWDKLGNPDAEAIADGENIASHIIRRADEHPQKICLVFSDGSSVTFGELLDCASDILEVLRKSGIRKHDRVLFTIQPCLEFYAAILACFTLGATLVVLDPRMSISRVNHCIAIAKVSAWIRKSRSFWYLRALPAVWRISNTVTLPAGAVGSILSSPAPRLTVDDVSDAEHALATFTTGSTGMPKLLLRKHAFLMKQTTALSYSFRLIHGDNTPDEQDLAGLTNLPIMTLHYLKTGSTGLLQSKIQQFDPQTVVERCRKHNTSIIMGSPAFVERLAEHCLKNGEKLPCIEALAGGAPVYSKTVRRLTSAVEGGRFFVVYGSTEAEPISLIISKEKMRLEEEARLSGRELVGHCVGKPIIDGGVAVIQTACDLLPEGTKVDDVHLPNDEAGEVLVRGWNVNTFQVPKSRLVQDNMGHCWLRTGDAGYLDDSGRIWLIGRLSWRVERNGRVFWSTIVEEEVLSRSSQVTFVSYLSHKGKAYLILEAPKGLPAPELKGIREMLQRMGVPVEELRVLSQIPRDRRHASKPDTAALFASRRLSPYTLLLLLLLSVAVIVFWVLFFRS